MRDKNKVPAQLVLLLLLGMLAAAQTGSSTEQKPASVSGLVTNGVTGAPLAHAHVRLDCKTKGCVRSYGAVSNEQGKFSVASMVAGTYVLSVERPGYQAVIGWAETSDERKTKELVLDPGAELKDLVLRLVPYAVISGRVIDANSLPLHHVEVAAISNGPMLSAETDDRGQFRIGGLRSGRYLIRALVGGRMPPEIRTDGTVETNYVQTYYPASRTAESAAPVQVRAGEETSGIEIKIVAAPILHISGTVAPGRGAKLPYVLLDDGRSQRTYPVGSDLRFTMWRVPPGRYQILAEYFDGLGPLMRSAPVAVNLGTSSIEGIHLVPSLPFNVAVQVEMDDSSTTTKTEKNFDVDLKAVGSLEHGDVESETNPDGSLKMTEVFPALYHISLDDSSHEFHIKSARLGDTEIQDGVVDLRGGQPKSPLVVELGKGGADISGLVLDANGPVSIGEVALLFDDDLGLDVIDTTKVQADGSYVFHGVAPGKYKIFAYQRRWPNDSWTSDALALYSGVTEKIEAHESDKIRQDLKFLP